jgi:hypothetical protein
MAWSTKGEIAMVYGSFRNARNPAFSGLAMFNENPILPSVWTLFSSN